MQGEEHETKQAVSHPGPARTSFGMPGFGQLMKGHFSKAFAIWAWFLLAPVVAFTVGGEAIYAWWYAAEGYQSGLLSQAAIAVTIAGTLAVWMWNVYDAYNS